MPKSSIWFAQRQLAIDGLSSLTPIQAGLMGEVMEARRVVWGDFGQKESEWWLTLHISTIGSGKATRDITASSKEWSQVLSEVTAGILRDVAVVPTPAERKRTERLITSSSEALELLSRSESDTGRKLAETEAVLRKVISLDPAFTLALVRLSFNLNLQGRPDEALEMAQRAARTDPDSPLVHHALGTIYGLNGKDESGARRELLEAIRLAPDAAENRLRLSEVYAKQDRWKEAVSTLQEAVSLAPYDASVHAELGRAYYHLGSKEEAVRELKIAERYNAGLDPRAEAMLAQTYARLNEIPKAIQLYESYLETAKAQGATNSAVMKIEQYLAEMKDRLNPQFISVTPPKTFTRSELQSALSTKLTPAERKLLPDAFACTDKMRQRAKDLVGTTQDPLEIAKRLFLGLIRHLDESEPLGVHTAQAAFTAWSGPTGSLSCGDYALLYMVMARSVGLKAHYVLVERDFRDRLVSHACAGVFVGDRAILVDLSYLAFGASHKNYRFLTDLETVALCVLPSDDPARTRIITKLLPDWANGHFILACDFARRGRLQEAHEALQDGLRLDSSSWYAYHAKGAIEVIEGNWASSLQDLKKCVQFNPDFPPVHYLLGLSLYHGGDLKKAREELRTYLQGETQTEYATNAHKLIAHIDEAVSENP